MNALLRALAMEWGKQRRSRIGWMIAAGACFTPSAVLLVRLLRPRALPALYALPDFWQRYWNSLWESMAVFLLPMGVILITAALAQLEHRNGTWKQLSTLPLPAAAIYFAKLLLAALRVAQFLLLFVAAGTLAFLLPMWLFTDAAWHADLSVLVPMRDALHYYLLALPILALQFALSLRYANFLLPVGAGFIAWIGALATLSWQQAVLMPYGHGIQYYMAQQPAAKITPDLVVLQQASLAMTAGFVALGLLLFATRPVKG
jgi:lantibiotic transport system permease protein